MKKKTTPTGRETLNDTFACAVIRSALAFTTALTLTIALGGCESNEVTPEITRTVVEPPNLPRFLRGTIRYEADLVGYGPTIATGYGIVVGLNGTGSGDIPVPIRAMLEREAAAMTEQTRVTDVEPFSVSQLLDSPDTAVVLVEAIIPPGAAEGTQFDVAVTALPATSTTSLEGGRLWTTRLMQGITMPSSSTSNPIAAARGDLYINPFASIEDEEASAAAGVNRRTGRILNGGAMLRDMPLILNLRTASYTRSRAITYAINARFPQEPGQSDVTARPMTGGADERIALTVPPSWRGRTDEFVETIMATPIRQGGVEQRAYQLTRWLQDNPLDAQPVSWCLVALGELAIPTIQDLYDYPESIVRLAALKAGAKLGDPVVATHLAEMARDPGSPARLPAIELLGELPLAARVSVTLRDLLNDDERAVRIAAFEGLRKQRDPILRRLPVGESEPFELYAVPSKFPMVYATQQKQPRLVVFGNAVELDDPAVVDLWSSELMIVTDEGESVARVRYEDQRTGEVETFERSRDVVDLIRFLGDDGRGFGSDGGLGLTYSKAVGALYALSREKAMEAPFIPERDQWFERYAAAMKQDRPAERPISAPDAVDSAVERSLGIGVNDPENGAAPSSGDAPESTDGDGEAVVTPTEPSLPPTTNSEIPIPGGVPQSPAPAPAPAERPISNSGGGPGQ